MDPGKLVFAQLMDFLPRHDFNTCVRRYGGDRRPRGFSCRDQFLCLAFAQLTFRESLRDIETCLRSFQPKLYHAGFRGHISRSTLADANRVHDWRIFADFAQVLIGRARKLVRRRAHGRGTGTDRLCAGQHHDRPLPEPVPVGAVSSAQRGGEAAHAPGSARQHPHFRADYPRENPRRHRPRPSADRAGFVLRDGSRVCRFSTPSSVHDLFGVLRDAGQAWPRLHPPQPSTGRQVDGFAKRPNDRAGRPEDVAAVPRPAASDLVLRRRERQAVRVPDQQLHPACADDRENLQMSMAGRIVLQMDQTKPAYQILLRDERQRGEDSSVDRDQRLRARRHRQEGTRAGAEPQRNLANSQPHAFREDPYFSGIERAKTARSGAAIP